VKLYISYCLSREQTSTVDPFWPGETSRYTGSCDVWCGGCGIMSFSEGPAYIKTESGRIQRGCLGFRHACKYSTV